jgi:uncharacterized membrane protein YecN with MAPEG domain
MLTIILTTILSYEIYSSVDYYNQIQHNFTDSSFLQYASPQLISNLFTDYLSLFVIRRCLILAGKRPLTSLIVSFVLGSILVLFMSSVMRWFENTIIYHLGPLEALQMNVAYWGGAAIPNYIVGAFDFPLMAPAIAVNLWMLFFAIGIVFIKALSPIRWLSAKVQWFLDHGEQHPLEAIGFVGAFFVFIGASLAQLIQRIP